MHRERGPRPRAAKKRTECEIADLTDLAVLEGFLRVPPEMSGIWEMGRVGGFWQNPGFWRIPGNPGIPGPGHESGAGAGRRAGRASRARPGKRGGWPGPDPGFRAAWREAQIRAGTPDSRSGAGFPASWRGPGKPGIRAWRRPARGGGLL